MTSIKMKLTVIWVPWQFQPGGRWVREYRCVPCEIYLGNADPVAHVELFHAHPHQTPHPAFVFDGVDE
jgi:hypothetical protein